MCNVENSYYVAEGYYNEPLTPFIVTCKRQVEFCDKYGLSLFNYRDGFVLCTSRRPRTYKSVYVSKSDSRYGLISSLRFKRIFLIEQYNLLVQRLHNLCEYVVNNCERKSFNHKKFYRKYVYLSELKRRCFAKYRVVDSHFEALLHTIKADHDYAICYQVVDICKIILSNNQDLEFNRAFERINSLLVAIRYWKNRYQQECSKF